MLTAVAPASPNVLRAMLPKETPLEVPISHMVLTHTSATSNPVMMEKPAAAISVGALAAKPAGAQTAGRANIPAPTAVPATSVAAPTTLPGSCCRLLPRLLNRRLSTTRREEERRDDDDDEELVGEGCRGKKISLLVAVSFAM